jgi:peroxiredoxin
MPLAAAPSASPAERSQAPIGAVGGKAPDFTLTSFNGKPVKLSALTRTQAVLLWFTNLCDGCRAEIPTVRRLQARFAKLGVAVVAVSQLGDDRKPVEDVLRTTKVTFPILYDPRGEATSRYAGRYIPGTCPLKNLYLIERGGTIAYTSHLPGIEEDELVERVEALAKSAPRR